MFRLAQSYEKKSYYPCFCHKIMTKINKVVSSWQKRNFEMAQNIFGIAFVI